MIQAKNIKICLDALKKFVRWELSELEHGQLRIGARTKEFLHQFGEINSNVMHNKELLNKFRAEFQFELAVAGVYLVV